MGDNESKLNMFPTGMIDGIVDKLHSNFQKQTGAFQDLLQQRLLRLKMALYSCKVPKGYRFEINLTYFRIVKE